MMFANQSNTLLTEAEFCNRFNIRLWTARRWRSEGRGPKFIKLGGTMVRYKLADAEAFVDSSPTGGAGQRAEAR